MKKVIQKVLSTFGYSLRKVQKSPFDVQRDLILDQEPIIFDVGAYTGDVAKTYKYYFPSSVLYCFEPFPKSFQTLVNNVAMFPKISCYELAVSDKQGTALLNTNTHSATNSLFDTDEKGVTYWGSGFLETTSQLVVCTTTVDSFCREKGISHIDILKMDVQGSEFSILAGAKNMLTNQKISLIYSELLLCPTYNGQHKWYEYLSFLDSFGFEFLDFFNPVRYHSQLIQADVVFMHTSLKKQIDNRG